jgi:hypothetical protein
MSGDNFHFDITGAPLELAMQVAFSSNKKAIGMTMTPTRLTFFWTNPQTPVDGYSKLPPMEWEVAMHVVKSWQQTAEYGKEPDHDGDNGKGLCVFNEAWGHINNRWEAFVAIEPAWIMYGK